MNLLPVLYLRIINSDLLPYRTGRMVIRTKDPSPENGNSSFVEGFGYIEVYTAVCTCYTCHQTLLRVVVVRPGRLPPPWPEDRYSMISTVSGSNITACTKRRVRTPGA